MNNKSGFTLPVSCWKPEQMPFSRSHLCVGCLISDHSNESPPCVSLKMEKNAQAAVITMYAEKNFFFPYSVKLNLIASKVWVHLHIFD